MRFVYDDGGRAGAGVRGQPGDCVARAIAVATGLPYQHVCAAIDALATRERRTVGRSCARTGVHRVTYERFLFGLGWIWTPTMHVGQGCRVHLRADELPPGRLIVRLSKHMTAVIDGVIHDTLDPSRDGMRCVYGYFRKEG